MRSQHAPRLPRTAAVGPRKSTHNTSKWKVPLCALRFEAYGCKAPSARRYWMQDPGWRGARLARALHVCVPLLHLKHHAHAHNPSHAHARRAERPQRDPRRRRAQCESSVTELSSPALCVGSTPCPPAYHLKLSLGRNRRRCRKQRRTTPAQRQRFRM